MVTENVRQTHRKEADAMQDAPCIKCKANLSFCIIFIRKDENHNTDACYNVDEP